MPLTDINSAIAGHSAIPRHNPLLEVVHVVVKLRDGALDLESTFLVERDLYCTAFSVTLVV